MRASAFAAADAFPAIEAAVGKTVTGGSRERRNARERALKEPVWQTNNRAQVSRQRKVCFVRRSKFFATYFATLKAESNFVA